MLPLLTFPICNVYFPKRLKPLAPNDPTHPATGMLVNFVTKAVPYAAAPTNTHMQLAPKKLLKLDLQNNKNEHQQEL